MNSLRRLWPYGRKHLNYFILAVSVSLLGQGASLVTPKLIERMVAIALKEGDRSALPMLSAAIVGLAVFKGVLMFGEICLGARFGQTLVSSLRQDLHQHLCRLSFSYFDRTRTGQLLSRITNDLEPVAMFMMWGIRLIIKNAFLLVGTFVICLLMDWRLTLVSLATMPLLIVTAFQIGLRIRPAFERAREQLGVMTSALEENIQGIRLVKIYNRQQREINRFMAESERLRDKSFVAQKLDAAYYPFTGFWAGIGGVLVLWYGGQQVIHGHLTVPQYVAFETYLLFLLVPMRMLGYMLSSMLRADASAERIFAILDQQPELPEAARPVTATRLRGSVTFDDVSFRYVADRSVLTGIRLEVTPGERIGIIGATGSGKSSLVSLIPRFYDPASGRVLIDGVDVREYPLRELRRQISVVFQDTFLFSGTLAENIAFGRPDDDEADIIAAAKDAAIWPFIQTLPKGLETEIGERGMKLSGGQQQRLAIARALLVDPSILILDDCTASVDTHTEYLIQQALARLMKGRTSFVIAQRASSVAQCDRIVVLEQGHIAEVGTPDELIARRDSLYARLVQVQTSLSGNPEEVAVA